MSDDPILFKLSKDQELILLTYYIFTNKSEFTYLQYTAACALIFFLTQKEYFEYNKDEILVYDYKEERRYIWEAKAFMEDINLLRDKDCLIRARSRSETYRDVNAHKCSSKGLKYIQGKIKDSREFANLHGEIKQVFSCKQGHPYDIRLEKKGPQLVCEKNAKEFICFQEIEGFLKHISFRLDGAETAKKSKKIQYTHFFLSE